MNWSPAIRCARGAAVVLGAASLRALTLTLALGSAVALAGKDVGPSGACDGLERGSAAWNSCIGGVGQGAVADRANAQRDTVRDSQFSDEDLFYAGYWLARLGRYREAIGYLEATRKPDARSLTYLGLATRKSGDVGAALPIYRKALQLEPGNVVTRAYLGEAMLSLGDVAAARGELAQIARLCGAGCAAYDELARHIARHEQG